MSESLEVALEESMRALYRQTGQELRYWARRFIQAVNNKGGLRTAKDMLKPRNSNQRAGLDRLIEANRTELSIEYLVQSPRFRSLFTDEELATARQRLNAAVSAAAASPRRHDFPDELPLGVKYAEGASKRVWVNSFERNSKAREACIAHHGVRCLVCSLSFAEAYGALAEGFIHVHHVRPLSSLGDEHEVDPVMDLVPVCPNCHAMLHLSGEPISVAELRNRVLLARRASPQVGAPKSGQQPL